MTWVLGGESRVGQQAKQRRGVRHRRAGLEQAALHRAVPDLRPVDPAAVVRHGDGDLVPDPLRPEPDDALGLLSRGDSRGRRLESMVRGVAEQVGQRLGERVQHRAVHFDVGALQLEPDFLAEVAAQVPHHAGKSVEDLIHRRHPGPEHTALQAGHQRRDAAADLFQLRADLAVGNGGEPVPRHDQLSDLVHQRVEALEIHPHLARGGRAGAVTGGAQPGLAAPVRNRDLRGARVDHRHQPEERLDQLDVHDRHLAPAYGLDPLGQRVHGLEESIDGEPGRLHGARANARQDLFRRMAQLGHRLVAQRRGRALDRVEGTKKLGHRSGRAGITLEGKEKLVAALEMVAAVGEEECGIPGEIHRSSPEQSLHRFEHPRRLERLDDEILGAGLDRLDHQRLLAHRAAHQDLGLGVDPCRSPAPPRCRPCPASRCPW